MGENTSIEWCHHTFNPWAGCTKVSPACDHCYAEQDQKRFKFTQWGPHAARRRTSPANWKKPLKWNKAALDEGTRKRVFCASWADIFDNHKSIDPEWRSELWALIKATPQLDWLLLTKRPQNIAKMLPNDWGEGYPNVWLGVSVENQKEASRRIPILLDIPAVVRFLSCEPLLEGLNLHNIDVDGDSYIDALTPPTWESLVEEWRDTSDEWKDDFEDWHGRKVEDATGPTFRGIDWVICGGESGPHARPLHPKRAFDLWYQCKNANVPFLFKQWGEYLHRSFFNFAAHPDSEVVFIDGNEYVRCGKKQAGRYLCAEAQMNEFPTPNYPTEALELK